MSFHYIMPVSCQSAIATLAPKGVTEIDCGNRILSVLKAEIGKVAFVEAKGKSKAFKRLKLDRKNFLASYTARQEGSTKDVQVGALDTYEWLCDVHQFEEAWGVGCLVVTVPKEIHGYVSGLLATMKPSLAPSVAIDASLEAGKPAIPALA